MFAVWSPVVLRRRSNNITVPPEQDDYSLVPFHKLDGEGSQKLLGLEEIKFKAGLPVDAHEKVGEETFVETQLPALLHVRKTEEDEKDNQNDNLMIKMIHINVCILLVKLINTVHPGQCNTIIMPIKREGSNLTKGHLNK